MKDVGALRRLAGVVNTTGAVLVQETPDWTVVRSSLGTYVITFARPFTSLPAVQVVAGQGFVNWSTTTLAATITTFSTANAPADAVFSFAIEGRA